MRARLAERAALVPLAKTRAEVEVHDAAQRETGIPVRRGSARAGRHKPGPPRHQMA
jgi:hypothetical protein